MKRGMWIACVVALAIAALAATTAAAAGGNSANAKLCQKGGWQSLFRSDGSRFANQGECVSYAAKGNTILTELPNPWKAACEQIGGTFSVSHTTGAGGFPLTPPWFAYLCTPVSAPFWSTVLFPICMAFPDYVGAGWVLSGLTGVCIRSGTV